ncbi:MULTISPECIES: hypothetical protein [Streptomyces]|uniref:Gram-positive cocci surface proteins LPxTG domain-containing protein n=1 Tax=Streptomyces viridochromogenes TaxID=1938 RepID=A0A0L8JCT0_STRVR|nr:MULTISPECIES: hypothetical protein [Streptomyces]KOG11488.1 hypothetical protein ADK34_34285 [Streptomyces viridochromogenes]
MATAPQYRSRRPRTPRATTAAATTAVLLTLATPAVGAPAPDPPAAPTCGAAPDTGFPIGTRIHGGPADYPAGGPFQEWRLDLTNTTDGSCSDIHPVLVLADGARTLRPAQIRFEFYDAGSARWRPVAFEATEEAESVGAFTDFGGFTVPAGETLTVPVRLAFGADAAPDEVVVNAAVVQRRGEDGDWIGESGDYRLTVGPAVPTGPDTSGPSEVPGKETKPPATAPGAKDPTAPGAKDPTAPGDPGERPELARTGRGSDRDVLVLAPFAAALVLLGAVLVRAARRARHR